MTDEPDEPPNRRGLLAAIALLAILIAGGLWLNHTLHDVSSIQDCVMAGRRNCAPAQ